MVVHRLWVGNTPVHRDNWNVCMFPILSSPGAKLLEIQGSYFTTSTEAERNVFIYSYALFAFCLFVCFLFNLTWWYAESSVTHFPLMG